MTPPAPTVAINSERDFVAYINELNAQWVATASRLSPRVLTDMYERASGDIADWFESQSLDAPAPFAVSWAGEQVSANWFDIGREFTELWHHQEQVRMAVGAGSLPDARYLHAVIDIAVRGLPHVYRRVVAEPSQTVFVDVTGPAGGQWTLVRESDRWTLMRGEPGSETARIRLDENAAWKLLFNALPEADLAHFVSVSGSAELAGAMLQARSVIV